MYSASSPESWKLFGMLAYTNACHCDSCLDICGNLRVEFVCVGRVHVCSMHEH